MLPNTTCSVGSGKQKFCRLDQRLTDEKQQPRLEDQARVGVAGANDPVTRADTESLESACP